MGNYVVPLDPKHDVDSFDCGVPVLNTWLQTMARQHKQKNLSQTFVLVDERSPQTIVGFYALALRGLTAKETLPPALAKRLPHNIPGYTLARLAVSKKFVQQGHGETLLIDAIARSQSVAKQAGGPFLFVDAKDQATASFYIRYGFAALPTDPLTLVLRLET